MTSFRAAESLLMTYKSPALIKFGENVRQHEIMSLSQDLFSDHAGIPRILISGFERRVQNSDLLEIRRTAKGPKTVAGALFQGGGEK